MTFKEVLTQVIDWLQQDKRISYRALKRQFDLDNEYLEDVKLEIIRVRQLAVDQDGEMLVWTGEVGSTESDAHREIDEESRFHALLRAVMALLRQERRVTYRELKHIFGIDDVLLSDLREELLLKRLAVDEQGKVLVWTGETQPITLPVADVPNSSATADTTTITSSTVSTLSPVTKPSMPSNGPTAPPEAIGINVPQDESIIPSEPTRTAPEAERRQLTVMFCDLADSTKLSQELDPEDLREVIRAYQQTSAEVIQRFDGYVAQHLGDGLLIYFGWPRAHEDDAQRALHAGLGIVEAITTNLNPRLEQEKGVQLTVRLGVHTGPAVVGEMGGGDRLESLATGETVNIAARLEGLAESNKVVVSSVTERLVRGAFALEDLGPQVLKGVTEPMTVFRVLSTADVHRDEGESLPDGGVFLIGRDEEIGLLLRRWEQSKEGLGQVVLISGEAGIGKSSLVSTVRAHVMDEGHTRITFRCSPYHTDSALYPVIMHLEQMLGFDRDDTAGTKLDKLEQALKTTNVPLGESVPLLATLLSMPLEDRYPALTLSPQQHRQQTLDTLVAWLMEESEKRPMLSVWEDLHWADPSTLEMLGLVLEQTPTVPMLHLLTFRPEFTPPWPTRSHMTPITLNRLERPQVEALITHLARDKALPGEVIEHIVSKTDGVPLYVEELTKMLMASDLLEERVESYVLTGPLSTVAIPDTLQDSLMARLDQLNQAKEIAQLGAVIGREFTYELIQAISSQDEETLQANLAQLVSAELLYQRGRPPRARYVFKHALIQDAAYASLLRSQRQQVHREIAQVLEAQFPETVATQPELLAHYYTEAGLNEQAVGYWQRAGERAIQRSANPEATGHLTRGLALLKTLPETPQRDQQELTLCLTLGAPLMSLKGYAAPDIEQVYARAYALGQQLEEPTQLLQAVRGLWTYHRSRGEYLRAREIAEHAHRLAQRQHDPIFLGASHFCLGTTLLTLGEFMLSRSHLEQAMALYDPQQQLRSLASSSVATHPSILWRSSLTMVLWLLGYPDQALDHAREAITIAQTLSHPYSLVGAFHRAAYLHQCRRDSKMMKECTDIAFALSHEHGFTQRAAEVMIYRGWVQATQEQAEEGIRLIGQGFDALRAMGVQGYLSHYLAMHAEAHGMAGQVEEGLPVLTEALAIVDKTEERWWEAELHRLKGQLLLQQSADNTAEAASCYQQAIAIAQNQSAKSWELRAATSLARLWQSQDKRKEAHDLLEPVYSWFTEGFDTADLIDAKSLLDELSEGSS